MFAAHRLRVVAGATTAAGATAVAWLQHNYAEAGAEPLPPGASVCVVGAGVVGVACAYELASAGYRVRVLEASGDVCGPAYVLRPSRG